MTEVCPKCHGNHFYHSEAGRLIFCECDRPGSTNPRHYNAFKIEPWDFIASNQFDFFEGNVIKYISRWQEKDGVADLEKAKTYIEKMIHMKKSGENDY